MIETGPLRLAVVGLSGRMGKELATLAEADDSLTIVGGIGRESLATLPALVAASHVVIDFSTPEVTSAVIDAVREGRRPMVIGTTGLTAGQIDDLRILAEDVPVWYARNMSTGVSLLQRILPDIARVLSGFDIEIVEAHHRHKVDAPSGTALMLADAILAGLSEDSVPLVHGREGYSPRSSGEIGMHSIRGGGNPGEHTVMFASDQEEILISHRAFSRQVFAAGAIHAARTIHGQPPGWYGPE